MPETIVDATRLSEKGQLVIPKEIRDRLGLKSGSKLLVVLVDDAIVLRRADDLTERMRFRELLDRARMITQRLTGR